MKNKITFFIFSSLLIFFSCEKNVSVKLNDAQPKLVVEASIENDAAPTVVLSNSVDYFSEISPEILQNSFVHGADILISNGVLTHKLKEYSFKQGDYTFSYYSIDSSDLSTAFAGKLNTAYSLKITVQGKEYDAVTTIPKITKVVDSVYWKKASEFLPDSLVALMVDGIDRMMQISAVITMPHAFSGEERKWYRGLAVMEGKVVPVINPDSFLSKGEIAVLEAKAKTGVMTTEMTPELRARWIKTKK